MGKNKKVVIVDYCLSNLFSVQRACDKVGIDAEISFDKKKVAEADALILPGVGSYPKAMKNLEDLSLVRTIKDFIFSGKPFMGICLGMQLLFSESEEFNRTKGLDVIKGKIKKFPLKNFKNKKVKIPHIGWVPIKKRSVSTVNPLKNIPDNEFMYFVHSFFAAPEDKRYILTTSEYTEIKFCSSILKDNMFAVQFHPEKSGEKGISIYREWAKMIDKEE